jgi:S1-C subfamily serine protease
MRSRLLKTAFSTLMLLVVIAGIAHSQEPTKAQLTIPELVKRKANSVVNISTFDASKKPDKQGSGFVVDADGTIVTAFHMLRGASTIAVKTHDGEIYDSIDLVQYDVRRDLAVIKIQPYRPLVPIAFAGDDELIIGEGAAAISNPQGLDASVSAGIISGYRQAEGFRLIQTTAPVSPGSSGGPLFNMSGNLVGMVASQIDSAQSQNLNFAVPVIYIRTLLKADRKSTSLVDIGRLPVASVTPEAGSKGVIESLGQEPVAIFNLGNATVSLWGCFTDLSRKATVCVTEFEGRSIGRYGRAFRLDRVRLIGNGQPLIADVASDISGTLSYLQPQSSVTINLNSAYPKIRCYVRFAGVPPSTTPLRLDMLLSAALVGFPVPTPTVVDGSRDEVRTVFDAPVRPAK